MWDDATVAAVQKLLDRSAATAGAVARKNGANPRWRLDARQALDAWGHASHLPIATMATSGIRGPHIAVVHAGFVGFALTFRAFVGSVRQTDLARNPRVALSRFLPDGTALTAYGIAREVPDSLERDPDPLGDGSLTVAYIVELTRLYAINPRQGRLEP